MFLNGYPYTDFHEMNLDFLLQSMNTLKQAFKDFTASNSLVFAEPLLHDVSKSYAKNTVVLDNDGNAYISIKAVPSGIQLDNTEYWLMVFNFEDYTEKANKNFTDNYFRDTERSDRELAVDDWVVLNDVLYKVTVAIPVDGLFEVGVNLVHFTVEQFLKDFIVSVNLIIQQYKDDIDASELAYQLAMQAEVDRILAGATVDSEVIDARTAFDGLTYTTLGNAIRNQIEDIHSQTPAKLEIEFTSSPQSVNSDFTLTAGKTYYFYSEDSYTGYFNLYVYGDSDHIARVYANKLTKFTPVTSGIVRAYNGNTNAYIGTAHFDVTMDDIQNVPHGVPIFINDDTQLAKVTAGTMSADDFPPNTIMVVGTNSTSLVNGARSMSEGMYITFATRGAANINGVGQLYISDYGVETRWKNGGSWLPWKSVASVMGTEYSDSSTYDLGDYCTRHDKLYRCIDAITVAESWTAAHWTEVLIGEEFDRIATLLESDFDKCVQGVYAFINNDTNLYDVTGGTNSANDFPANRIIVVGSDSVNLLDAPRSYKTGTYITFSPRNAENTNGNAQVFISDFGIDTRWRVGGTWSAWFNASSLLAAEYDSTETYAIGDYCTRHDKLARCISAITTPESWDGSHWHYTTVGEELQKVNPEIYHVGIGQPYTSLTHLLIDLKDNTNEKVIYIHSGTYDIFDEYMTEVGDGVLEIPPDDVAANNYDFPYNAFIPTNTKVIGLGEVILEMMPSADDITLGASYTWSPVNVYGSVEIENIEIHAKNVRYCIHNDDHGTSSYYGEHQKYKNVRCFYEYSDLDGDNNRLGYNITLGFGVDDGGQYDYEDCLFYFSGANNHSVFYGHDRTADSQAVINMKNCVIHSSDFSNNRTLRLQSINHNAAGHVLVNIDGCYISGSLCYDLYHTDTVQSFEVTLKNTNKVTVNRVIAAGGTVSDPYTTRWFNPLATPTALAPLIEEDYLS